MRKFLVIAGLGGLLFSQTAHAQYYFFNDKYLDAPVVMEIGVSFGGMNALTDIGGRKGIGKKFVKDLNWKFTKPCYGVSFLAMYRNAIGLRLEGTFGQVMAYDSILKDVKTTTYGRYERNLSFKSRIADFQLAAEVHPLYFNSFNDKDPPRLSPYVVVGVGYFSFDPKARLDGQWYSLAPLHTEGQGFREYRDRAAYKLHQLNIAAGIGVRYEVNSAFNARLEVNHRFLRTDYLDDVSTNYINPAYFFSYLSLNQANVARKLANRKGEIDPAELTYEGDQRGNPENNDSFFTIQLKLSFSLRHLKK